MNTHDRPNDPVLNAAARALALQVLEPFGNWGSFSEQTRVEVRRIAREVIDAAEIAHTALEYAAQRYVWAVVADVRSTVNGRGALELMHERECAEHDLFIAAGAACVACRDGDCPGRTITDTQPL